MEILAPQGYWSERSGVKSRFDAFYTLLGIVTINFLRHLLFLDIDWVYPDNNYNHLLFYLLH